MKLKLEEAKETVKEAAKATTKKVAAKKTAVKTTAKKLLPRRKLRLRRLSSITMSRQIWMLY